MVYWGDSVFNGIAIVFFAHCYFGAAHRALRGRTGQHLLPERFC